jgi:hypothetical protein
VRFGATQTMLQRHCGQRTELFPITIERRLG